MNCDIQLERKAKRNRFMLPWEYMACSVEVYI